MKIYHMINSIGVGGSENFLFNFIKNDKLRFHYIIVTDQKGVFFKKFLKLKNCKIIYIGSKTFFFKYFLNIFKIKKFFKLNEPLIVNTWMYKSHIYASIMKFFFKFSLIFHIRHVGITQKHNFSNKILIIICSLLSKKFCNYIIYNSFFSKLNHEKYGYKKKNSLVFHNGFELDKNFYKYKNKKKDNSFIVIGMLSRVNFIKDHETLIKSFLEIQKTYKNVKLILKGQGLEKFQNEMNFDKKHNIIFQNASISVEKFFSEIDINILSSYGESFPNVVAESMLRGIPTISSNVGDAKKIVLNKDFLFEINKKNELIFKLKNLIKIKLNEQEKWKKIQNQSTNKIIKNFNFDITQKNFLSLWDKIAQIKKKIVFIIPTLKSGGAERVISNLSNDLIKKNFAVDMVIFGSKLDKKYKTNKKINIRYLNKSRSLFAFVEIIKIFFSNKYNYALSTIFQANILSVFAKVITFSKTILYVRETNTPSSILKYNFSVKNFLIIKLRLIYVLANLVLCNSKGVIQDLKKLGIKKSKLFFLPNSLNNKKIISDSKKKIINFKKPYFIFAGRLSLQKNLEMMIRSFSIFNKKNKSFYLYLIGDGEEKIKLNNLIKRLKLNNNIYIKKYTSNIYPYIKHSKALLMTSKWEGMSNVLQETLVLNKPAVVTNCKSGPLELKKNGYNLLLSNINDNKTFAKNMENSLKFKRIDNKKINNRLKNIYNEQLIKLFKQNNKKFDG